jgi:peptide/nickel transport system substrate-binding protein
MNSRKMIALLVCLLLFAACSTTDPAISSSSAAVSGSGSAQSNSESAPGAKSTSLTMIETLHIGITKDIEPRSMASEQGSLGRMNYNAFCAGTFMVRNVNNDIQPNLMTKWETADDGLSIVAAFATDQGITWHDGRPFTIDDVVFTIGYMNDVMKSGYLSKVESVDKLNDTQIRMNLVDASAYYTLGNSAVFARIFPRHIWEGIDNPAKYVGDDAMIGCGPYKVTNVDEEARTITFEAVADTYMGKELTVRKVVMHSYESQDALVMALVRGEVDAMNDYSNPISPTMLSAISDVDGLDPGKSTNLGLYQIVFGFNQSPTNDVEFRKAVRLALDYQLLASSIGGEDGKIPHVGIITPNSTAYDASLPQLAQNPDEAAEILGAAGYIDTNGDGFREKPDGSELSVLVTPQYNKIRAALNGRIAEIIIDNLGKVGVRAVLDEKSVRNEDHEVQLRNDKAYEIYINYSTQGVANYRTAYLYMIDNPISMWGTCTLPEFVQAYDDMLSAAGPKAYADAVKRMQNINAQQVMGIALCWDTAYYPYRTDKYEGWVNYPGWGVINQETWYNLRSK